MLKDEKIVTYFFLISYQNPTGVKKSGKVQETRICLFGALFFSQNGKNYKYLGLFRVCLILAKK